MNIQSNGRIAAFAAPWFRVLSAFILIGSSAAAFAGEEKAATTRFVIQEDSTTSISIRATSLREMISIWLAADRAAKNNRLHRWIVEDGLALASRKSKSKYPINTSVEFDINDPHHQVSLTSSILPCGNAEEIARTVDAKHAGAELTGLLNASARRSRSLFGRESVIESIRLDLHRHSSFQDMMHAGMLVIEVEVQSRIGNDESSVALLVFVVTKNWGIGVNLPNSTIKYLPTNLWPYDFSCQDGYDDVFGVLWSTEPCKDGKLKSSENK